MKTRFPVGNEIESLCQGFKSEGYKWVFRDHGTNELIEIPAEAAEAMNAAYRRGWIEAQRGIRMALGLPA
jgi:hypothetical protein